MTQTFNCCPFIIEVFSFLLISYLTLWSQLELLLLSRPSASVSVSLILCEPLQLLLLRFFFFIILDFYSLFSDICSSSEYLLCSGHVDNSGPVNKALQDNRKVAEEYFPSFFQPFKVLLYVSL